MRSARHAVAPVLFSLCSSLFLLSAGRATAQNGSFSLVTGSTIAQGSGVALGTTPGLYAPGIAFAVESAPGAAPSEQTLRLGAPGAPFFVPDVEFVFGSTFAFTPVDETGAPTDALQLTLDLETGEIATGADDPLLRLRIDEYQGFQVVNTDVVELALTTGTVLRPQCGAAAPGEVSGAPLDANGDAALVAAICIGSLGASTGFNTPLLVKLDGSFGPPCADGIDNDGDTAPDFPADPGCEDPADGSERDPSLVCDDGVDNDGDGLVDFPADPDCESSEDPSEEPELPACADDVDNDGDGRRDFPADPGCDDSDDASEQSPELVCDNGLDDDGDGWVDSADPACLAPLAPSETAVCDNGLDDDGDGAVDLDDPSCPHGWWPIEEDLECGLGFELAFALPLLLGLQRLRRRAPGRLPGRGAGSSRP